MTPSDIHPAQPLAGQVVVRCPGCGAAETVDAAALAGQSTIHCRECGETWPAPASTANRRKLVTRIERRAPVLVAEKRTVVSYSEKGAENAWKSKIEGDYWPEPPRHSRLPMLAAAVASLFFFAAFLGGRQAAVAALPDLAGLYAAIGLPVNLDGFRITDVKAERVPALGGTRLIVHANVENIGSADRPIPALATLLYSEAAAPAGAYGFDAPERVVTAGETVALAMQLESAPKQAAEVVVRFRRRGEQLAAGGAAQTVEP